MNQRLPPVLNYVAYLGIKIVSPLVLSDADRISPIEAASKIPSKIPVLVLAGTADKRAFVAESQSICDCCKDSSELIVFDGADHLQLLESDPHAYRAAVLKFIEKCKQGGTP